MVLQPRSPLSLLARACVLLLLMLLLLLLLRTHRRRASSSSPLIGRRPPSNTISGATPWLVSSCTRDMK